MKEFLFKSFDGKELVCYLWDSVKNPKGIIQIVHGMTSHMMRYEQFAFELNKQGYIAFGDDHRPHGKTAGMENLGNATKTNFDDNVKDEIELTKWLKAKYNLPVQLFAHSYGSFIAQRYIQLASELIGGIIISGSSFMGDRMFMGKVLTFLQRPFYKMDKPNQMLFNMTFNSNNKFFMEEAEPNAWLNRDMDKVKQYNSDPFCNFIMTHGFYYSLMRGLARAYKQKNLAYIRKDLPIYIMSGEKDPLGGMGKKVTMLYELYKSLDLKVKMKLWKDARHELTSDLDKDTIIADMIDFYNNNTKGVQNDKDKA